ncbi:MAG: tryptophan synthase subunit alpha [Bacteroidales bacterium]
MNRINEMFQRKQNNILSVYFTAGYPEIESISEIIQRLEEKGADMIEIGIPYSDPIADGPVIQKSSQQAIRNGMSIPVLFRELKDIRNHIKIPLIIMTYFNPVFIYGFEEFCKECSNAGIDGLIIPDLPIIEYNKYYKSLLSKYNLKITLLVTSQTSEERIKVIDELSDGFIYMVSSCSTTGLKESFTNGQIEYFKRIENMNLKNPVLIGFGISNRKMLADAFNYANGAIVGSLFIDSLSSETDIEKGVNRLIHMLTE